MASHRPDQTIHIDKISPAIVALLRNVADEAATRSVSRMLVAIGLDPDNHIESQACFVRLREMVADPDSRADTEWTRRTRKRSEGAFGKALFVAVGIGVLSGLQLMAAGAKSVITAIASIQPPSGPVH